MTQLSQAACRNRLLTLMSPGDFALLAPALERVDLPQGQGIAAPGEPFHRVFFPESGIISIVAMSPEGQRAEAGLFGRCGFGPYVSVLGVDQVPNRLMVQVAGSAHSIELTAFMAAVEGSVTLRHLLQRFLHTMMIQTAYTALSNAVHQIDERLARWLLMVHDRGDGGQIALTHEFLSIMLSVRRPSVTTTLHVLEGNRLIRSERGLVTVLNRAALEDFAGDAYGTPEAEYRRLIGAL